MSCELEKGITYNFDGRTLKFNFELSLNDEIKIKFKYKSLRNEICKYYRSKFIGIQQIFSGVFGNIL